MGKELDTDCRIALYKSFISSNFSYCPVSCIFFGKRNSDKLEKLQERALRFVFSDYTSPYRELLKHGHFLSLSALRIRYLAIEMYKYVHGLNPPYLNDLFKGKNASSHFVIMVQNCGTPSQQRLRSLKIYTYNGIHDMYKYVHMYAYIYIYIALYMKFVTSFYRFYL